MTRRRLMLLVPIAMLLAAGVLATRYAGCGRSPQPETPPKAETPAPEAPPRKPLTEKERLLVGTWKLVKITPPLNPDYEATEEFRSDGTFTLWLKSPLEEKVHRGRGTYRVQGDLLIRTWTDARPMSRMLIDSLTEDRLVLSVAREDDVPRIYDFIRVREN